MEALQEARELACEAMAALQAFLSNTAAQQDKKKTKRRTVKEVMKNIPDPRQQRSDDLKDFQ